MAIRAILVRLQDLSSDGALTVLAPCLDMLRNTNRPQYLLLVAEIIRISPTVKETSGAQLILKLFEDLPSSLPLFGSKLKNSDDLLRMFPEDKLQLLQGSTAESVSTSSQRNAARTWVNFKNVPKYIGLSFAWFYVLRQARRVPEV